jgi:hypothetical protein
MVDIESQIRDQYAKFFVDHDWYTFKTVSEHYLQTAAKLKKCDIEARDHKLLLRNVQKRLFIGIACELLLKAFYLKRGYCINRPINSKHPGAKRPCRLAEVDRTHFKIDRTHSIDFLVKNLERLQRFHQYALIENGFRIARAFRNKEGHVAVSSHKFSASNYEDVAAAFKAFYQEAFYEDLLLQIAMGRNESAKFRVIPR